jgi:hypothetical protein
MKQYWIIHSSDILSGFDSLYLLTELSCVLLTHLLQLLNQLSFSCELPFVVLIVSHFNTCLINYSFLQQVFRSQDYNAIMYCLKQVCAFIKCFVTLFIIFLYLVNWNIKYHLVLQLFEKVEATKPTASRSTSAEIYIICLKYKAPAKIQPELLDIKHLFSVVPEQTKVCWATCHLSSFFSFFC